MATEKGTNGQEKAQQTVNVFSAWAATQTKDDFNQIIFRGQLNRVEVAKAIGCGKSALIQNPALKAALHELECKLRDEGILPCLSEGAKESVNEPVKYNSKENRTKLDTKRLSLLEVENIELKSKINELENKLKRFGELSDVLSDMGFMPR